MDQSGEDRISSLPDEVICHILSRLPTKDAVQTSILSKYWEHKWTSVYNIQLDDRKTSLRGKIKNRTFVSFIERVLNLTQNSRIKSFHLFCSMKLEPDYLKKCINSVLLHGVQNLEINTYRCRSNYLGDGLYICRSLTELKLISECILWTSVMNCFPNLKTLYLCQGVTLFNAEFPSTRKVLLDFPVLEELELRCCGWWGADTVDIDAPALVRFLSEGHLGESNHCVIKINGAKLQKFESCGGLLKNFVVTTPSVSRAVLTSYDVLTNFHGGTTLQLRAHAILKGFPALESLKLSREIVKALTKSNAAFPLPFFNVLNQLELCNIIYDKVMYMKLLEATPSLESLSLYVYNHECNNYYEGLESLPAGIASRLKVVKLLGFRGLEGQFQLASSVLKNADNLEELFVSVSCKPLVPKIEIRQLLLTFPKSSNHASVVVDRFYWTKVCSLPPICALLHSSQ